MPFVRFVELPGLYQPYEFAPVLDHSVSRGSLLVAANAVCLFATVDSKALRLENFRSKYPNIPSGSSSRLVRFSLFAAANYVAALCGVTPLFTIIEPE